MYAITLTAQNVQWFCDICKQKYPMYAITLTAQLLRIGTDYHLQINLIGMKYWQYAAFGKELLDELIVLQITKY